MNQMHRVGMHLQFGAPYSTVATTQPVCYYSYGTEYFYVDGSVDSTELYLSGTTCY